MVFPWLKRARLRAELSQRTLELLELRQEIMLLADVLVTTRGLLSLFVYCIFNYIHMNHYVYIYILYTVYYV